MIKILNIMLSTMIYLGGFCIGVPFIKGIIQISHKNGVKSKSDTDFELSAQLIVWFLLWTGIYWKHLN